MIKKYHQFFSISPVEILVLILLLPLYVIGQDSYVPLQEVSKDLYTNGRIEGKFHEFENHFKLFPEAHNSFLKFDHNRKAQRITNYTAAGIAALGLINGFSNTNNNDFTETFGNRAGSGLRLAGAIAIFGNIIAGQSKKKYKNELLDGNYPFYSYAEAPPEYNVKLNQMSQHKFSSGAHVGDLHEFGHLFEKEPQLNQLFHEFNDARKKQTSGNTAGVVISILGIGSGLIVGSNQEEALGQVIAYVLLGGTGFVGGGAIFLVTNLTSGKRKAEYRSRLLSKIDPSLSTQKSHLNQLGLGLTSNGLGLVYTF